ncbi:iron complex outermembrane recepter protein [Pustulibacterium marinum]|uniref:Iron complex outermembrane recepter protein n=1 Tax=Pustulibacterium marinum TaxID=1224947 RepID=A0A1I7HBY1_9FLAO|nr:TonB-dependent receptor [Pustulibacterium marinum]SFU58254.1 iron complex outermembrane recepter protein [Pustulibacterium marinum]
MKKYTFCLGMAIFSVFLGTAQDENNIKENQEQLDEVVVSSSRIDLPFPENSRTITVITSEDIKKSGATTVVGVLQQIAGVDIRRRGLSGSQADLYIRGGSFDQTLLLIDGIKVEDVQTGHHTLNLALPIDVIERIEIIKGPAARVFGQNAFTGAVNIVTKKNPENMVKAKVETGSFHQKNAEVTVGSNLESSSHIINYTRQTSEGYRHNTDYDNQTYFLKSTFNKKHTPINVLATLAERKFGANGFYATPTATEQYEETQASLVGISSIIEKGNLTFKPRAYWRRNQDMYLYTRSNPDGYRNMHITNKVGAEVNASYKSKLGVTGFGVDVAQIYISSNNLGEYNRFMTNVFLEHQFNLLNEKLDITPGVAVNYFSDFKFHAFPGIDLGYQVSDAFKAYANVGYTYRVPTYTDLYYTSGTTMGNANLDTEEAFSQEVGLKFFGEHLNASVAVFNRSAQHLIDYVKENEADLWQAQNIRDVDTKGIETEVSYAFKVNDYAQQMKIGYMYLNDDVKNLSLDYSQYSINSMKHHFTGTYSAQFIKNLTHSIIYKYVERTSGQSYNLVDASATYTLNAIEFSVIANNIFNTAYTETNLVPMPKGNVLFGFTYNFK